MNLQEEGSIVAISYQLKFPYTVRGLHFLNENNKDRSLVWELRPHIPGATEPVGKNHL